MNIHTDVLIDRDYEAWHAGIEKYGFWCLRIHDAGWLERISKIQAQLYPVIQSEYERFPHVTVATVGLMKPEVYSIIDEQKRLLVESDIPILKLAWGELSSYVHSPIVRVKDVGLGVGSVRKILHSVALGDDERDFDPHITVGYYSVATDLVLNQRFGLKDGLKLHPFDRVQFCTYRTSTTRGSITVELEIPLGCDNSNKPMQTD